MTAADVGRFVLIIALGFLAFVTFLFATTIVGSMWLEASRCKCLHLPVGLYVLGLIGILLTASIIVESFDAQPYIETLLKKQRDVVIAAVIFVIVIILILI